MANLQSMEPQTLELTAVTAQGTPLVPEDQEIQLGTREWVHEQARRYSLLIWTVLVPTLVATLYFGIIAADQYVSEARFVVRSVSSNSALNSLGSLGLGGASGTAGTAATVASQAISKAPGETYSVNEFIRSRDAVDRLIQDNKLLEIFSRNEADLINRYPNFYSKNNKETLYKHYLKFIDITVLSDSGISVLETRAFRPEDAREMALALLRHAETLVNKLNARAREDSVRFAQTVVQLSEERISDVQKRITEFRNKELIVDPSKQSEAALELVARLTGEVALERAQLENIMVMTPSSPQIGPLRTRIRSMEDQIIQQRALIVGGDKSMAHKLSQFEQISLERDLAVKQLTSALASLENARQEAQRQQLYLERVVEPHTPDYPLYPKRLMWIGVVFVVSLCLFWIVREFRAVVLEHRL